MLSPGIRQVTHALLTRPPLRQTWFLPKLQSAFVSVRLACVKHAASVHPEPGSNSRKKVLSLSLINVGYYSVHLLLGLLFWKNLFKDFQGCICCSVIKDQNFCSETLRIFNGAFLKFLTRSTECCLCLPRYFTRQVLESKINTSFERSAIDLVVHKSIEAFLMPATLLCYHFKIA